MKAGGCMAYNFDFSYLKNGAPAVTLSSFGIAFNKGAIESLGVPDQVIIGYDQEKQAIGVRARGDDTDSPYYDFAPRVKNDWIRIGAKDFMKYLSRISRIDFLSKAKQFIAEFDEETQTLVIVIDEEHLKWDANREKKKSTSRQMSLPCAWRIDQPKLIQSPFFYTH